MPRRDREPGDDLFLRKQEEVDDIELFLGSYERATGEKVKITQWSESPDAICCRSDGTEVGIEFTQVRRSPAEAVRDAITYYQDEMDVEAAFDEVGRLLLKKTELRKKFCTDRTILVIAVCEADFDLVVNMARDIPVEDFVSSGFEEVWLADFKGIREGAHREVRLFGLYPAHLRVTTERSMYDQKPYG